MKSTVNWKLKLRCPALELKQEGGNGPWEKRFQNGSWKSFLEANLIWNNYSQVGRNSNFLWCEIISKKTYYYTI